MSNVHLNHAKITKNDEYYTYLDDIQKELDLQSKLFFNKVIFLAFDDYKSSNFFSYFKFNFNRFKLKKLICLSKTHKVIVEVNKDEVIPINGEFDKQEWNKCLEECDLVVTNPPFSILLNIIKKIKEYKKHFLLIIPLLSASSLLIFEMIKNNQLHFGNYCINKFFNPLNQIVTNICYWASSLPLNIINKQKKRN